MYKDELAFGRERCAAACSMQPELRHMFHPTAVGLAALVALLLAVLPTKVQASPALVSDTYGGRSAVASRLEGIQNTRKGSLAYQQHLGKPAVRMSSRTRTAPRVAHRLRLPRAVRLPKRASRLRTAIRKAEPQHCRCRTLPDSYRGVCFYYVHPSKVYCERRTCQAKYVCDAAGRMLCMKRHITQRIVQVAPHRCRTVDIPCSTPKSTMYVPYAALPSREMGGASMLRPERREQESAEEEDNDDDIWSR